MINIHFSNDPLTGLNNLFGLLECDFPEICGSRGAVIAIDICGFNNINVMYGRDLGDICIKTLSQLIQSAIDDSEDLHPSARAFRTGGDEFTLIMPLKNYEEACVLADQIDISFRKELLRTYSINTSLRISVSTYTEEVSSPAVLLKLINKGLSREHSESELPSWANNLLENLICRTKDTLSLLRAANDMALSDEVSGLQNHRAAEMYLSRHLEQYHIHGKPFSILFIDGDNLKQYNQLGYQRGNQMIRDLGSLISASLRRDDHVFRWLSGDEFLVILPGAEREDALKLGERIRAAAEEGTKAFPFPITVSIGVATCPTDGITLGELLSKAETANSAAKCSGKNKVS